MAIYWRSRHNICCYTVCLFHWYIIHSNYNIITLVNEVSVALFKYLLFSQIHVLGFKLDFFFHTYDIFTFTLTCFIIPCLIWITFCTVEFAFKITWYMFCHCFSFIFVCYHIQCFNIYVFCFFLEHIFLEIRHYKFQYIYLN